MKNLFSVLFLCLLSSGSFAGVPVQQDGKYALSVGNLSMVIDANLGARVVSLQCEGKEVLTGPGIHPTNFGSTFWTSPQAPWNWPPVPAHDNLPYQVEKLDNGYRMTSGTDARQPFRIVKVFQTNPRGKFFQITYSIVNVSNQEQKAAAWEVTRVPGAGLIFFAADTATLRPRNVLPLQDQFGLQWFPFEASAKSRKLFANGDGWLAYLNDGVLFLRSAADISPLEAAPKEDEIEIYVNPGTTYIELENQGRYTTLQPGESLTWAMKWKLFPSSSEPVPSKALKKEVLRLLKK